MFQEKLEEISKLQDDKPTSPNNNLYENLKRQIECYDKLFKIGRGKEASPFLLFKILKGKEVFIRQCLAFSFSTILQIFDQPTNLFRDLLNRIYLLRYHLADQLTNLMCYRNL